MDTQAEFDSLLPATQMDRRDFVTTLAAAGFALAVQPVQAQTVITTDTVGLATGSVNIAAVGGSLPIYFARPADGQRLPTVLVVQEIFGVHEHIRDVCRRLAKLGYLAIAPELYFRQGDPSKIDNIPTLMETIVSKVSDAQVLGDLDACAAWAAANDGDPARLAITGFCWGGRVAWLYAAHNAQLRAAVAWYGRLDGPVTPMTPKHPKDIVDKLEAPVLGLYGGKDQGIPLEQVEAMRTRLRMADRDSEMVVYPDAPHAFHADYRPSYRSAEAMDGWQRMQAWFKRFGV